MNVWTCDDFEGHYPGIIGTAAVVVAGSAKQASDLLNAALRAVKLKGGVTPDKMRLLDTSKPSVVILSDGNY